MPRPPELPQDLDDGPLELESGGRVEGFHLTAPQLPNAHLRAVDFREVRLDGGDLEGLRGADRLAGVAMPWPDIVQAAGTFATAIGVTVAEDD